MRQQIFGGVGTLWLYLAKDASWSDGGDISCSEEDRVVIVWWYDRHDVDSLFGRLRRAHSELRGFTCLNPFGFDLKHF